MRLARTPEDIANDKPEWRERKDRERIASSRWGKDHWSLFAYVEIMVRTRNGLLDWDSVGISAKNWPMLYNAKKRPPFSSGDQAEKYGLRLKGGESLKGVCEADALMDLVDAGLVTITMPPLSSTGNSYLRPDGHALNDPSPRQPLTGLVEWMLMPWARFGLTETGWSVGVELAKHKSAGGTFASFDTERLAKG